MSDTDPIEAATRRLSQALEALEAATERRREADEFHDALHAPGATPEERRVQRQALAGMLWGKQAYLFDVAAWQDGDDPSWPPPESRSNRSGSSTAWT